MVQVRSNDDVGVAATGALSTTHPKETSRVGSEVMRVHGASRHQVDIERRVCICSLADLRPGSPQQRASRPSCAPPLRCELPAS